MRDDNAPHWNGSHRGVYEVWYLTWNDPATGQGFWLRYCTEAPVDDPPRRELWFARFDPKRPDRTFGIHKHFIEHDARLDDGRAVGELAGGGHAVRWDLSWDPAPHTMRLLPDAMYARGGLGETTVLSPNPRVLVRGTLTVDGETLRFDGAVLGQTHLWGKKHAYSWTWGRCADFAGADGALLELLGVRLQRRSITLPPMVLVVLDLDGERYRLNQFRHVVRNRGSWQTAHVEFRAWSPRVRIEGELTCAPDQMITAPYVDPDGTRVYCANTEIGDARVTVFRRGQPPRQLEARGRAHFEVGGRMRDPAVVRDHVLV